MMEDKGILHEALQALGFQKIRGLSAVRGGDIGKSFRFESEQGAYFVKYREDLSEEVFKREAEGLELLRSAEALAVPTIAYAGKLPGHAGGLIVLEWIEQQQPMPETDQWLGKGLARLHSTRQPNEHYGLDYDNFIGTLVQPNRWSERWIDFLRDQRLSPMVKLAGERGLLAGTRHKRLYQLLDQLESWVPPKPPSVLLHGDLWSGNWLCGAGGRPYLIDPAVFYGDREFEIAFTELFGGFAEPFYASYQEMAPLSGDYEERRPLYQLYYLLVHLILFGEAYGASVDRVLRYYVG